MLVATVVATACALAAGRAVPWQGRQLAVVMAAGMFVLCAPVPGAAAVEVPRVLVAAVWTLSSMLGTAGLRGRPEAEGCRHRAVGGVVMTLCLMGGSARMPGSADQVHAVHQHGVGAPLPILGALAVLTMVVWTVVGVHRSTPDARTRTLLHLEAWAMTIGLVAMWLGHAT